MSREATASAEPIAGDDPTAEERFALLCPSLRRFAAVVSDRDIDPDDLVQDALVRVIQGGGLERLDHPVAYFRRTITNLVADHRRGFGRRRRALRRADVDTKSADRYPSDLSDLDQLTPIDRAVFYLADIEGMPLTDVATELGLTHQAARSRASRARSHLRATIDEEPT